MVLRIKVFCEYKMAFMELNDPSISNLNCLVLNLAVLLVSSERLREGSTELPNQMRETPHSITVNIGELAGVVPDIVPVFRF